MTTTITALGTPPNRDDQANFRTRGDAFMAALPTMVTQINALAAEIMLAAATAAGIPTANAAGTVDAITAAFSPTLTSSDNRLICVRSAGANTSTTPTLKPDALAAETITTRGGAALEVGDIGPAGSVHFYIRNPATSKYELLNPTSNVLNARVLKGTFTASGTVTFPAVAFSGTNGTSVIQAIGATSGTMLGLVPGGNGGVSSLYSFTSSAATDYAGLDYVGEKHNWYRRTGVGAVASAMTLDANGDLVLVGANATKASGTTWANPSDVRVKNFDGLYTKGLAEILRLEHWVGTYNGKGGTTEGVPFISVKAQDAQADWPDSVSSYRAKLNKDDAEDSDILKWDSSEVVPALVNSVKSLHAEIEALRAEVAALKGI